MSQETKNTYIEERCNLIEARLVEKCELLEKRIDHLEKINLYIFNGFVAILVILFIIRFQL